MRVVITDLNVKSEGRKTPKTTKPIKKMPRDFGIIIDGEAWKFSELENELIDEILDWEIPDDALEHAISDIKEYLWHSILRGQTEFSYNEILCKFKKLVKRWSQIVQP